jgi:transposase
VTFLDEKLRGEERQSFFCNKEAQLAKQPLEEQDFEEVFTARKHTFGTLTLTYDFEKSHTAQEIYEIYKQRNEIEVMFSVYKTFLKADKSYMQNRYVLEGWLFVNFIAMLAYFKLFDRLREEKLVKKMSPADVLHCAQGIYQNYNMWTKQWVRTEMTKKSRELFKKLRIDPLI